MKAAVPPIARRIDLNLDGSNPWEALILNRYERMRDTRREEWLRGLLVRGFENECGVVRTLQREEQCITKSPLNEPIAMEQASAATTSSPAETPSNSDDVISFAALRKVIG